MCKVGLNILFFDTYDWTITNPSRVLCCYATCRCSKCCPPITIYCHCSDGIMTFRSCLPENLSLARNNFVRTYCSIFVLLHTRIPVSEKNVYSFVKLHKSLPFFFCIVCYKFVFGNFFDPHIFGELICPFADYQCMRCLEKGLYYISTLTKM